MTIVIISLRSDSNNVLKDYLNKDHLGVLEGTATTRKSAAAASQDRVSRSWADGHSSSIQNLAR